MGNVRKIGLGAIVAIAICGLCVGIALLASHYLTSQEAAALSKVAACTKHGPNHAITIKNDVATPDHVTAPLCDTLTITNADDEIRLIAFGPHEHHQPYDGITEEAVSQGGSVKLVLNQAGTFHFHDHIHDEVTGDFTVVR